MINRFEMFLASLLVFSCICLIISCSNSSSHVEADLIIKNGKIWTGDVQPKWAEALAIEGDKILAIGSNTEILNLKSSGTQVIDVQGQTHFAGVSTTRICIFAMADFLCWKSNCGTRKTPMISRNASNRKRDRCLPEPGSRAETGITKPGPIKNIRQRR